MFSSLRRLPSSTLRIARPSTITPFIASPFSNSPLHFNNDVPRGRSFDDHVQGLLNAPDTKIPHALSRIAAAVKVKFGKDNVDPQLKTLLDRASAQIYYDCANNFDYEKLCENFGLGDYMSSWYKLTLMHTWMVLLRLHVSLDADAYMRLQRGLLSTMWLDIDQRLAIISEELNQVMTSNSDMKHMHGLHLQTFLEYDEGFLGDDRILAGAIWRCLYLQRPCDPIHVSRVINYIRSTVGWLDTLDMQDILVGGIPQWKQIKPRSLDAALPTEEQTDKKEATATH